MMLFLFAASSGLFAAQQYTIEDWNVAAREKFAAQRFGIFIHWGLYASYAQGEWYLQEGRLDRTSYERMMHGFYPSKFNAQEWVDIVKSSGAKYITITSRHHDGFSLWPTKVDDGYNIANTPFKRDILGELAKACHKENIQLNFYYSLMDWHRSDYPAGKVARSVLGSQKGDYKSYKKFMMDQITELIDNYKPGNIWFDGEWEHYANMKEGDVASSLDWEIEDIYALIHSKKTLVANNNHKYPRITEDIQIFERDAPGENTAGFSKGQTVSVNTPLEQCDVIQRNVWGYKIGEKRFFTPEQVVTKIIRAASKNSNLLMNIGPDASGQFPEKTVKILSEVGKWMDKNGESIYGTTSGSVTLGNLVVSTQKSDCLYLHFVDPNFNKAAFSIPRDIRSAVYLDTGKDAKIVRTDSNDVIITIDRQAGDKMPKVVKISFK
jgi:alpha-L-fucosidase